MEKVLITGGSGFFGHILISDLLKKGYECINIDLVESELKAPYLTSYQGDIRDLDFLKKIFNKYSFSTIFHCAAILAHGHNNINMLWSSNVMGTRNIAECAKEYNVKTLVFTSSNCLWAKGFNRPVIETDIPSPVEIYGKSKWESEKILNEYSEYFNAIIIRCPTIMDSGRLGLLGILFEFIDEGRKVWIVGNGKNKYQFIYAKDLSDACIKFSEYNNSDVFNIGSDNVKSFKDVYQYVIDKVNTGARVAHLPDKLTKVGMKAAYKLGISPFGPYQYKMITEDFIFDTQKIKNNLKWAPTLTNEEMLFKAYQYYKNNLKEIKERKNASAHRSIAKMGIIKILKWLS